MPAIMPPPGTERSASSMSWQPAGERGELEEGNAGVEQARDALARQQLAALVEQRRRLRARRPRARLDRAPALDQRRACARGCAANASLRGRARASRRASRARLSVAQHARRRGEMKAVERLRSMPPVPTSGQIRLAFGAAPSTRRQAPEMKAAAGESRKTIAAETSLSVPRRCSGTSVVHAAERRRHLGRVAGPGRSRRSSPARPR